MATDQVQQKNDILDSKPVCTDLLVNVCMYGTFVVELCLMQQCLLEMD